MTEDDRREQPDEDEQLRVLSFNIWRSGGLSLDATIEVIRRARADVVGLQECSAETAQRIANALDHDAIWDVNGHAILSPHNVRFIDTTNDIWGGLGATIDLGEARGRIHVFDAHLHWTDYGPYFLHDGRSVEEVLASENATRMLGLHELLHMMTPALGSNDPTFLVGDFNAPSHRDYDGMPWPTSYAVEQRGLEDSYRLLHPENRLRQPSTPFAFDDPGITWTPLVGEEVRGVFDRIDFVYFTPRDGKVRATESIELDGRNSVSPWPSDHRAVLSTFAIARA